MSQSVGSTKIIQSRTVEVFPGSRDYEFTKVIGGRVVLFSEGHDVEELSDIPVIRTAADTGDHVLFALEEATTHTLLDEFGEASREGQREKPHPKKRKASKDDE